MENDKNLEDLIHRKLSFPKLSFEFDVMESFILRSKSEDYFLFFLYMKTALVKDMSR